jgi:hypothetical protein
MHVAMHSFRAMPQGLLCETAAATTTIGTSSGIEPLHRRLHNITLSCGTAGLSVWEAILCIGSTANSLWGLYKIISRGPHVTPLPVLRVWSLCLDFHKDSHLKIGGLLVRKPHHLGVFTSVCKKGCILLPLVVLGGVDGIGVLSPCSIVWLLLSKHKAWSFCRNSVLCKGLTVVIVHFVCYFGHGHCFTLGVFLYSGCLSLTIWLGFKG